MANLSLRRSFSSLCTGSSASNSTCPTAACLLYLNAFLPRLASNHPPPLPLPGMTPARLRAPTSLDRKHPRSVRETLAGSDRPEPAHFAADGLRAIHRDPSGGRPLSLGSRGFRGCRLQRRTRRPSGPHPSSADSAGTVSRSHCRQTPPQHHVPRALHPSQDSVEIHGGSFQPRHFHPRRQCRALRHCRPAQFPPQHFRQSQHFFADQRRFLRPLARNLSSTLDLDCPHRFSARDVYLYDRLGTALRDSCSTAFARAHSRPASGADSCFLTPI